MELLWEALEEDNRKLEELEEKNRNLEKLGKKLGYGANLMMKLRREEEYHKWKEENRKRKELLLQYFMVDPPWEEEKPKREEKMRKQEELLLLLQDIRESSPGLFKDRVAAISSETCGLKDRVTARCVSSKYRACLQSVPRKPLVIMVRRRISSRKSMLFAWVCR